MNKAEMASTLAHLTGDQLVAALGNLSVDAPSTHDAITSHDIGMGIQRSEDGQPLVEIRPAGPNKGLGIFAITNIPRGTLILREHWLVAVPHGVQDLNMHLAIQQMPATDVRALEALAATGPLDAEDVHVVQQRQRRRFNMVCPGAPGQDSATTSTSKDGRERNLKGLLNKVMDSMHHNKDEGKDTKNEGKEKKKDEAKDSDLGEKDKDGEDAPNYNILAYHAAVTRELVWVAILRANAVELLDDPVYMCAVFALYSRLNHSCVPNVQNSYHMSSASQHSSTTLSPTSSTSPTTSSSVHNGGNDGQGENRVYAIRPIRAGEELTVAYIDGGATSSARNATLQDQWGFRCGCEACVEPADLSPSPANIKAQQQQQEEGVEDTVKIGIAGTKQQPRSLARRDHVRENLGRLVEALAAYDAREPQGPAKGKGKCKGEGTAGEPSYVVDGVWSDEQALEASLAVVELLREEGLVGSELAYGHYRCYKYSARTGDLFGALWHAQKQLEIEQYACGADSDDVPVIESNIAGLKNELVYVAKGWNH